MILDDLHDAAEDEANELLREWEEYVWQMRKLCAKQKTPFSSSRKDMKVEIGSIIGEVMMEMAINREDRYLPLKKDEIIELFIKVILEEDESREEDEDDDIGFESEWDR